MHIAVYKKVQKGRLKGELAPKLLSIRHIYRSEKCPKTGEITRISCGFTPNLPLIIECTDDFGVVYCLKDKAGSIGKALSEEKGNTLNVDISLLKHFLGRPEYITKVRLFPSGTPVIYN